MQKVNNSLNILIENRLNDRLTISKNGLMNAYDEGLNYGLSNVENMVTIASQNAYNEGHTEASSFAIIWRQRYENLEKKLDNIEYLYKGTIRQLQMTNTLKLPNLERTKLSRSISA